MRLTDPLELHFRLAPMTRSALARLGVRTVCDLLYHLPARYESTSDVKRIADLATGDTAIVYANVSGLKARKAWRRRIPIAEGTARDASGSIKVMWFNQPYLAKMIHEGAPMKLTGKVSGKAEKMYLANPEVENVPALPDDGALFSERAGAPSLYPVYPESRGVSSKWMYHATQKAFGAGVLATVEDPIPKDVLDRYHLPALATALVWAHAPKNERDATAARKRFAFEEVFLIQVGKQRARRAHDAQPSFMVRAARNRVAEFVDGFPFAPTDAQRRAIEDILTDFEKPHAMSRLLEGDVGSGKTAVAAATAYAVATTRPDGKDYGNLQVAYMAPTEILAKQHFESFIKNFGAHALPVGLITGSGCMKFPSKVRPGSATDISRAQLLKWVANGEIPILVGTHALIQKSVTFKNLAYVIIDEQHRFGTGQRRSLVRKDNVAPHLLSMTATPIPRTLALTVYGDLDLTLLDEMPAGRKQIKTEVVVPDRRAAVYEQIRAELAAGRQAYVICPRIDEPDPKKELVLVAKSVKEEAKRLKKDVFPEYDVDILHSKMTPAAKDAVMERFVRGETHILVATSVVEVGVNVENATVIVIEGAERFGLAQLHQLRGRVIRSNHQAYCFAFTDTKGGNSVARLKALTTAKNGFELAEFDLAQRGAGDLYGRKQWGISDIGMEAMKNLKMVEAARAEAARLVADDPALTAHPLLRERAEEKTRSLHFE